MRYTEISIEHVLDHKDDTASVAGYTDTLTITAELTGSAPTATIEIGQDGSNYRLRWYLEQLSLAELADMLLELAAMIEELNGPRIDKLYRHAPVV